MLSGTLILDDNCTWRLTQFDTISAIFHLVWYIRITWKAFNTWHHPMCLEPESGGKEDGHVAVHFANMFSSYSAVHSQLRTIICIILYVFAPQSLI